MAEDILDHDHRRIDDQPEVDRADRQQICRLAAQHEHRDRKEQGERDRRRDGHGAAKIAEEQPLHDENQHDAEYHVVQHSARRQVNQVAAVVDALDLHAGRQDVRAVDFRDFGLDAADRRHALFATAHQYRALNDVVVIVLAGNAKTRLVAGCHSRDIADPHRDAIYRCDHRVADLIHRVYEADAADNRSLWPKIDGLAANIDVAVVERLQHLRQGDPMGEQTVQIDGDLVGLGLAAPSGDVEHPRHRLEPTLEDPVLDGLEVGNAKAGWADHPVTVDLADRAPRRYLRGRTIGQRPQLRQPVDHPLLRLVISKGISKLYFDVRQPE